MNIFDPAQTLDQRLSTGRLPAGEALMIGALVADRLRQLHDLGRAHGALTPSTIALDGGAQLLEPPVEFAATPYTAPELLQGRPADARSDIFALGAILYEMLTGRRAFDADTPPGSTPASSGSPTIDRLVAGCVAASPEARFQRVQKIQLELTLLMTASRRGEPAAAAAPSFAGAPVYLSPAIPDAAVRSQMQELESRMAHRFQEQDRAVANLERVANEVLKALRAQAPAAPPPSYSRPAPLFADVYDAEPAGRVEKALQILSDKIARIDMVVGTVVERIQKLEENLEAWDTDAAALRDSVTRDVRNFERALKQQSIAIESARTAMGQTDDLVERVVEALDSLQSMFTTSSDERAMAAS